MQAQVNQIRARAIRIARVYKELFLRAVYPRAWLFRWLFRNDEDRLRVAGQLVLSDLRDFCHANDATIFDKDPLVMARREGRREVFVRIQNFLNLDEDAVQKLMEIDDGY